MIRAFAAAALLLAAAPLVDRPDPRALRVVAGPAATAAAADPRMATLPRFALFGWVSPPLDQTTPERYAELAGAGFNTTVLAWGDSGALADNRARLDASRPVGVRNLILDIRLARFRAADTTTHGVVDTVVADYANDPALLGWYLGDEPPDTSFAFLGALFERFRRADAVHPAWNNLLGRAGFATREAWLAHTRAYVDSVRPTVLCNDHYDFLRRGDQGLFVENVAGLASVAREHGLPFWGIVQLVEHGALRRPTAGLLRWQVAQWLAHGARGVGYFTYWTPAPDTVWNWQPAMIAWGGTRTATYDTVRDINVPARVVGEALAGCTWLATSYTGGAPQGGTAFARGALVRSLAGRATLGVFADSTGAPRLFVANRDSAEYGTVTIALGGARSVRFVADDGAWHDLPVTQQGDSTRATLALSPGGFTLLAVSGTLDDVVSGRSGPRLNVGPNPAQGEVRFEASELSRDARLEVLDLSGRRVWSVALPAGARTVRWAGERERGGRVSAGVYFARLEDARGVAVKRVAWLGAR